MSATFDPRRSRWIPWAFAAGMLTVVAVNGVLITSALSTFTGVTVSQSYDRGRAYNQVLAEAARQEALGWRAEVTLGEGALRVMVLDAAGQPVRGRLEGVLRRPLEREEMPLDLAAIAPGAWLAPVALRPGQWEARLSLAGAEGQHLDIRQRLVVP
ncbi:FixH family protein [Siccirubricoccus sp. G192]|uniref:FixH family protein n=1 Tax=Siccirubricoccus sp. G192 TaxID=2849651 RepID=UPI001C2C95C0|nr:FixH family protein [Siccirubricoccus sp. G192]MBV1797064.1 FixH family protein [Siccirubricoccus sp. G192]